MCFFFHKVSATLGFFLIKLAALEVGPTFLFMISLVVKHRASTIPLLKLTRQQLELLASH